LQPAEVGEKVTEMSSSGEVFAPGGKSMPGWGSQEFRELRQLRDKNIRLKSLMVDVLLGLGRVYESKPSDTKRHCVY
jgi:hypothetical protein